MPMYTCVSCGTVFEGFNVKCNICVDGERQRKTLERTAKLQRESQEQQNRERMALDLYIQQQQAPRYYAPPAPRPAPAPPTPPRTVRVKYSDGVVLREYVNELPFPVEKGVKEIVWEQELAKWELYKKQKQEWDQAQRIEQEKEEKMKRIMNALFILTGGLTAATVLYYYFWYILIGLVVAVWAANAD